MSSSQSEKISITAVYKKTFQTIKNNSWVLIPFVIFALFESLGLILFFLAVRMPFKLVFGSPIRTFWGEIFLHYPTNFLLLPKLSYLNRMALNVFLGSLLMGVAVAIIFDIHNKKTVKLNLAFKSALKKYLSLFIIVLILTVLYYFLEKIVSAGLKLIGPGLLKYVISGHPKLSFLAPGIWISPVSSTINFLLAVLVQSAFIYAIPILMIEKGRPVQSILQSFRLFIKRFIPTVILVALPMLIYIPILVINSNTAFLINRLFPEFVLWGLFLSIIISSLVIDPIVTVSTTIFYLQSKENL